MAKNRRGSLKGMTAAGSTTVAARIALEDYDAIRRYCEAEQIPRGEWVRRAVRAELDRRKGNRQVNT